jgi:hypothetical protein
MNTKEWINEYFKETWKEIETDVDFSKHEPISTSNSLHIYEERYEIGGKIYRLLFAIGHEGEPLIEVLLSPVLKC